MSVNDILAANVSLPAIIEAPRLPLPVLSLPQIARFVIDEESDLDPTDGRWKAGVTFRKEPLVHAGGWAACGAGTGNTISIVDDCDPNLAVGVPPVYLPFAVTYSSRAPLDQFQALEYQARAERGLRAHEWWKVENELWTGTLEPGNRFLAKAGDGLTGAGGYDVVGPGAPVGLRQGISQLDQAIADADVGPGMIHMTPYMMESIMARGGTPLVREAGRVITPNGNWIVPGNGYTGAGPAGAARTSQTPIQWVFATDMMWLGRGVVEGYPQQYPKGFDTQELRDSDYYQSLVNAGTQVPMLGLWVALRYWIYVSNTGLRAGIQIDSTVQ